MKRKELLALPQKEWGTKARYGSIMLVPSGKKHDSGYMCIAVIGCNDKSEPVEIAAMPDDISWQIPSPIEWQVRMDCLYPSGIMHMWSRTYWFEVGNALSSTDIKLIPRPKESQ